MDIFLFLTVSLVFVCHQDDLIEVNVPECQTTAILCDSCLWGPQTLESGIKLLFFPAEKDKVTISESCSFRKLPFWIFVENKR